MKISLKKLLFIILTAFSVIFIGACGKSKINKEEVLEKFITASESVKSADIFVDIKTVHNINGNKNNVDMTINGSIIIAESIDIFIFSLTPF